MMHRVGIIAAALALLAACGAGGQKEYVYRWDRVTGPDGTRDWFAVECEQMFDCYKIAGRACRRGYSIEHGADKSTTEGTASAYRIGNTAVAGGSSSTMHGGSLLIHCKSPTAGTQ